MKTKLLSTIFLSSLLVLLPSPALAAEDEVISVTPLTHMKDGYFEAMAEPGETIDFTLRIATTGENHLKTYISNAVPRVNGGFSVDDISAELSGSSQWFSYTEDDFALSGSREETYSLTVPLDTTAGEFASGIVVETDYEDAGDGIKHRYQQTVPVNIVVEGEATPAFSYGSASHDFRAGKSSVMVQVLNEGNRHVSPAGTMEIREADGDVVSTAEVKMNSVYTGTTALADVTLNSALLPGDYTAHPSLTDTKSKAASAVKDGIPFTVEGKPEVGDEKNGADVTQEQDNWMLPLIAGLLLILILLVIILLVRRKKQ